MTDEVVREFVAWWIAQGNDAADFQASPSLKAFAAGWWSAVRTNLENARRD